MKYLTDQERELCKSVKTTADWGNIDSNEIHRLAGAYCWEIYDKWNGSGFDWVPIAYKKPLPL